MMINFFVRSYKHINDITYWNPHFYNYDQPYYSRYIYCFELGRGGAPIFVDNNGGDGNICRIELGPHFTGSASEICSRLSQELTYLFWLICGIQYVFVAIINFERPSYQISEDIGLNDRALRVCISIQDLVAEQAVVISTSSGTAEGMY